MKKILSLALALALTASLTVNASAAQEVIGHALYTDIVAEIDGHPIASYNVGGRTAVMVQDLNWYGGLRLARKHTPRRRECGNAVVCSPAPRREGGGCGLPYLRLRHQGLCGGGGDGVLQHRRPCDGLPL